MKTPREIIKGMRVDRDLTQKDIANILETSQQHYSKYENGEYELPLRTIIILADYYGVSADYLLGRTRCKDGLDGLNRAVNNSHTAGDVISDILSLSESSITSVLEYICLQKMKEACVWSDTTCPARPCDLAVRKGKGDNHPKE